eukprot:COSAG06_NODE_26797_length_607_cov_0.891732_1_plen_68_part_10
MARLLTSSPPSGWLCDSSANLVDPVQLMRGKVITSFPATKYGCIYVSYCQDATTAKYGAVLRTLEGVS